MSEFVKSFVQNKVLHVELERADKKNALTPCMYAALTQTLQAADSNPEIHVILLKGGRYCFCAGNDIADFLNESAVAPGSPIFNFLHALVDVQKPMIAAVSGPAIGIGTTMLLHCDLVYATEKSIFSLPFVNLGVSPEAGSSYLLKQQIGHVKASELLLMGEKFDANTALEYGLINEIVEDVDYWQYAATKAESMAAKPNQALMAAKSLLKSDSELLHAVIDAEISIFSELLKTDDAKSIFKKFLNN